MKTLALGLALTFTLSAGLAAGGFDESAIDAQVAPGDDFFQHANGAWLARTPIPDDQARLSNFSLLALAVTERVHGLLEEAAAGRAAAGSPERQAGDLFASLMDEARLDARGLAPLRPALARIAGLRDRKQLARLLGEELRNDVDPLNLSVLHTDRLFGLWVAPDLNDTRRHAAYLLQGGLGMPERAFYLDASPRMQGLRAAYRAHIEAVFRLAGMAEGAARAERVLALETKMAQVHVPRAEAEDVKKGNNPWKRAELAARAPGLDWEAFLAGAGLARLPVLIAWHAEPIRGLAALVGSEPLEAWKDWLAFHAADRAATVLPRALRDERFAFYGKALTGVPVQADRWKRASNATAALLPDAVSQLYVGRYFPPESKAQVQAMVANVVAAFQARIDRLAWMSDATKAQAKAKLATLYVGIGYPDKWRDTRALVIRRDDAFGNLERAVRWEYQRALSELDAPVEVSEWAMSAATVNAINLPLQNALNFPAAILQPPFFDPAAPAAVNYGSLGGVIGHEISHSFDDQGAEFDAHGRLLDWWTPEDRAHFAAAGAALVAQFDDYAPFPDAHVNGRQTLSENLADLAGLSACYDAWRASLGAATAPAVGAVSGEQQFFIAFAQSWREKTREPLARQRLLTDGHAPGRYRAAVVRNLDAWYAAFDVRPGQALYLAPEARVRVW
jgi:putative endopeptidase